MAEFTQMSGNFYIKKSQLTDQTSKLGQILQFPTPKRFLQVV